jgi:hypothetical protein
MLWFLVISTIFVMRQACVKKWQATAPALPPFTACVRVIHMREGEAELRLAEDLEWALETEITALEGQPTFWRPPQLGYVDFRLEIKLLPYFCEGGGILTANIVAVDANGGDLFAPGHSIVVGDTREDLVGEIAQNIMRLFVFVEGEKNKILITAAPTWKARAMMRQEPPELAES